MKIICEQKELYRGINIVNKAVLTRTPMSILECFVIEAKNNTIKLIANDLELGIETIIKGTIEEEGSIAINSKDNSTSIKYMPDNELTIISDAHNHMKITCVEEDFESIVEGKSTEEFPELPIVNKNDFIEISEFSLKEMIQQTNFSVSTNENNKILTGELFDINGSNLRIIAMDGHRISIRNMTLSGDYGQKKVVIPGKELLKISNIIEGSLDKKVKIYFTDNNVLFDLGETTVVTRIIEGEYFNVDKFLSKDYSTLVKISKKDLLNSVRRANDQVSERDNKPMIMDIKDGFINYSIQSSQSSVKSTVWKTPVEKEGLDLKIGFNPKLFIDAIGCIKDEEVKLFMDSSVSPCFIKNDEEEYIYIILPMNIVG